MPEQPQPTFKIVTGALKAVDSPDGRRTLHCTASSTILDRHGDEITEDCLRDMSKQALSKAMNIFLNHSTRVPEDVFGKTIASQVINRAANDDGSQIWDMDLDIELASSNDRTTKTWQLIKDDGLQLGVSIGALIDDWEYIDKDAGFWGGLRIKKVDLLEASIVGVPANQRSWVQNAVKAIKSFKSIADDEETPVPEPIVPPTPETPVETPEPVAAAVVPETPETPESVETPQELPAVEAAALEGGDPDESPDDAADEVSDADIVLVLTLQIEDLKAKLKASVAEIETYRQKNAEFETYVKEADAVLATVAKTPLGRKTAVREPVDTFHTRVAALYGEKVAKTLEIANG